MASGIVCTVRKVQRICPSKDGVYLDGINHVTPVLTSRGTFHIGDQVVYFEDTVRYWQNRNYQGICWHVWEVGSFLQVGDIVAVGDMLDETL